MQKNATENKEKIKKVNNKKKIILSCIIFVVLILTAFLIKVLTSKNSGITKSLEKAINSTMKLNSFKITSKSVTEMKFGDIKNKVTTSAVLSNRNKFKKAMYEINTVGEASNSPNDNFDVTATFFNSDGKVFESIGGPIKNSEVTMDEFMETCKEVGFYDFKQKDLANENISEQNEGISVYKYTLKNLDGSIIDSHLEQYKTLIEDVRVDEIVPTVSEVAYIVQKGMAISQELKVQTKVVREGGEYSFSHVSTIVYVETEDKFDFSIPNVN